MSRESGLDGFSGVSLVWRCGQFWGEGSQGWEDRLAGHLLLAGYLGCGNLGDDAVMLGFVEGLGSNFELTALSGAPEETYRMYGIPSRPRMDTQAIDDSIRNCDALVFPGGSIFQDATSFRSVAYYRTLVKKAKRANKKVFLVGQGVGPVNGFFARRLTAAAFNMADGITVRDSDSMTLLRNLGVQKPIRVTADSAFLLPRPTIAQDTQDFAVAGMKTVGISVRPHGKKKDTVALFAQLCRLLFEAGYMPVLVEMDKNEDYPLMQEISKENGGRIPDMRNLSTPMQVQQRFSRMDTVIAMRLHAGILAASVGVPPLMVSYDPKVTAFAKTLDIGSALQMEGLTAQRILDTFVSFQKDRERNAKILEKKLAELSTLARTNVTAVTESMSASVG
ncbi:MAG: polysaccharide pyruvyl transferase CsaB [Fimbriimonas sp.]